MKLKAWDRGHCVTYHGRTYDAGTGPRAKNIAGYLDLYSTAYDILRNAHLLDKWDYLIVCQMFLDDYHDERLLIAKAHA